MQLNNMFNKPEKPTVVQVFQWLISHHINNQTKKLMTLFSNIGKLTALFISKDLVKARVLSMPFALKWAESIWKMGNGSKAGLEMCGLVGKGCSQEDFCLAFESLDKALQMELKEDEKEAMGENIVMLEHALCKINKIRSMAHIMGEVLNLEIYKQCPYANFYNK